MYLITEANCDERSGKKKDVDEVEAICDLIFECLKFLFPRFHPHSIQRKIDPRKICNSFTKIDIINISKVFLPL